MSNSKVEVSTTSKVITTIATAIVIGFVSLVIYGWITDCPNTATYVYCGAPWNR